MLPPYKIDIPIYTYIYIYIHIPVYMYIVVALSGCSMLPEMSRCAGGEASGDRLRDCCPWRLFGRTRLGNRH